MKRLQIRLIFGIAKRNAFRSKYRSSLLILGIALTLALETGIVISVDTLYDDFVFNNRNQNFTDITVIPKTWANLSSLQAIATDVRSVSGVTRASPVYAIPANRLVRNQFPESNVLIYGVDPKTHPDISTLNITDGEQQISGNTVLLSQTLFDDSGLRVGDTVNLTEFDLDLVLEPELSTFTIGGVMSDPSLFGNNIGYLFILIDIDTLIKIIPVAERPNILRARIDVSIDNLLDINNINEKINDKVGIGSYVWSEKDISELKVSGIRAYQTALNLVILASFVVEFLFIANILAIAIRDRSKEFGILRAVGSDSKQLLAIISMEILIYSVIGSIFGILGGIGFASVLMGLMQSFYPTVRFKVLSLHSSSLIATLSSGVIVAFISGMYPVFIALTMPIVQNIHSRMHSSNSPFFLLENWKYTVIMGSLIALTGFILQFFVGPSRFLDFEVLSIHFFVILLIFIGTIFVEIGFLIFLPKIAFYFLSPIFGVISRTISMRNVAREFQKSLFTIMTAALALTFIIVVGLVSAAVIAGFPVFFQEQWGTIDLVAEARDDQLPDLSLTELLDQSTPIVKSSFIQEERAEIQGVSSYVYGVDPEKYAHFAENIIESISNETSSSSMLLNQSNGIYSISTTNCLVSRLLFERLRTPVGSDLIIKMADNSTVNVTVAAVIKSNVFLRNGEYLYISATKFSEFFNSSLAKWFVCEVEGNIRSGQTQIEAEFPYFKEVIGIDFFAKSVKKSLLFQSAIFQLLFVESFILAAIAQFVCILVSTLRMEREMGVMRAIGLPRRGVFDIFMAESIALGLTALIIGLVDGLLGSILLTWYINLSIPIEVEFPLDRINTWVIFSFMLTLASTILPSFRSSRKNIVSTISRRPFRRQYVEEPLLIHVFYPLWQTSTAKSVLAFYDAQRKSLQAHEEKEAALLSYPPTSLRQFIKSHKLRLQVIFLILVVVIAFSSLFNSLVIIRGLIPFDFFWRLFFSILPINKYYNDLFPRAFLFVNPILLFVGLTAISPITYYLVHESPETNPFVYLVKSFLLGIVGLLVCVLAPFIISIFLILVVGPVLLFFTGISYQTGIGEFIFSFLLASATIGLEILVFQRLWVILVFHGLSLELNFGQKVFWLEKILSTGQIKFFGLIFIHFIIQWALFSLTQSLPEPLLTEQSVTFPFSIPFIFSLFPFDPLVFLILATFEAVFLLLLIIFQIVQSQNQINLIYPSIIAERITRKKFFPKRKT